MIYVNKDFLYIIVVSHPQEKARQLVQSAIASSQAPGNDSAHSELVVRVNGTESGLLQQDLEAVFRRGSHDSVSGSCDSREAWPDSIMLPKVDSVEHLLEVRKLITRLECDCADSHHGVTHTVFFMCCFVSPSS